MEGLLLRFVRALVAEQTLPDSAGANRMIPPMLSPAGRARAIGARRHAATERATFAASERAADAATERAADVSAMRRQSRRRSGRRRSGSAHALARSSAKQRRQHHASHRRPYVTPTVTEDAARKPADQPSSKPIRCAVIQLARLGDTLQSLMALRAAKQLYPQLEITFVARERFAAAAQRVSWIDQVIALPTGRSSLSSRSAARTRRSARSELKTRPCAMPRAGWSRSCASPGISSSTGPSRSRAATSPALLPSRVKLGYSRRKDLTMLSADGWSHYIQAVVQGGVAQNIHLTDILTTQLLTALQIHFGEPRPRRRQRGGDVEELLHPEARRKGPRPPLARELAQMDGASDRRGRIRTDLEARGSGRRSRRRFCARTSTTRSCSSAAEGPPRRARAHGAAQDSIEIRRFAISSAWFRS